MPFTIRQARTDDAAAIAKIFTSDETSSFLRLQLGTVNPAVLNQGMTERLAESIQKPDQVWVIACDDESGEIVSYAQWVLPRDEFETVVEKTPEERAKETEEYRRKLLPGMNEALTMDFREGIRVMREDILKGRRHYSTPDRSPLSAANDGAIRRIVRGNVGTLSWYKRRGAATALISWPFEDADKDKLVVYLDTDQNGGARRIYERLGFHRAGEAVFDLSESGSTGIHTHIGMIREPQRGFTLRWSDLLKRLDGELDIILRVLR